MERLRVKIPRLGKEQLRSKLADFAISFSVATVMGSWWALLTITLIETCTK